MNSTTPEGDLAFFVLFGALFFAPSIVAFARGARRKWWVLGVNVLLGGTGIGWILAWAIPYFPSRFSDSGTEPSDRAQQACPSCGRYFDPSDYRVDAPKPLCSYCQGAIPLDLLRK